MTRDEWVNSKADALESADSAGMAAVLDGLSPTDLRAVAKCLDNRAQISAHAAAYAERVGRLDNHETALHLAGRVLKRVRKALGY